MSYAFLLAWGDLSPQASLGLDTDEGLTLTHRVAVLDEPFDDLSRPRRSDRPLPTPRHDGTQLRRQGHHRAGRRGIKTAGRRAERARGRRHDQPPFRQVAVPVPVGL